MFAWKMIGTANGLWFAAFAVNVRVAVFTPLVSWPQFLTLA